MGSSEPKAQTPLTVNNNCLTCSGNTPYIKKAFKMACLQYASSKVKFNNQEFTRD